MPGYVFAEALTSAAGLESIQKDRLSFADSQGRQDRLYLDQMLMRKASIAVRQIACVRSSAPRNGDTADHGIPACFEDFAAGASTDFTPALSYFKEETTTRSFK